MSYRLMTDPSQLYKNYIADTWATGEASVPNINPSDTDDCIGLFAQASAEQVDQAVSHARAALPALRNNSMEARQKSLDFIGNQLMARADELGELLAREEGKPFAEGRGEVFRAGQFFTYFAAEALRQIGSNADSVRPGIEIDVRREPLGVVGIISPWNFPTATASWKIAPALAFGNAVIWKPANQTPASAWALAEIIAQSGLPDGAFQLLMGSGGTVGQRLADHPGLDGLSFTGSLATGRKLAMACAANFTKYQLELGSKNALLVMDDADLDVAVTAALVGAYSGTGQKCTASSRLIVHEAVHDAFVEKLCAALEGMTLGSALDPATKIGPVVSQQQLDENKAWIQRAQDEGATLAWGGDCPSYSTPGYYMRPALFTNTTNDMPMNREELFAPIAAVIKVADYAEGLKLVNDTDFGLVAGIITQSLARATHFRRHAETGVVTVNLPTAGTDYHVPFGGRKNSSFGPREQGYAAAEFFTTVKTAYIAAGAV